MNIPKHQPKQQQTDKNPARTKDRHVLKGPNRADKGRGQ